MKVRRAQDAADGLRWDRFLARRHDATHCHLWGWKGVVEKSFGWPTFYLLAEEGDDIRGVLPLVWQKSRLFGSFLTSFPYLNAGGALAEDDQARDALVGEAIDLARRVRARHLELRYRTDPGLPLPTRRHKVAMVLPLTAGSEAMWTGLPHKVRTDVRKGMKSNLEAEFGGREFLDDFYAVFARNMRDLGTPVYGRRFFAGILRAFPEDAHICRIRHRGATVAVSFLIGYRETLEAVWSASRYDYLAMRPNMFLYWSILRFAAEKGFRHFDFGRSTIGSGTHQFKKQWGAGDVPLHWAYWLPGDESLPELNPQNPRYRLAIRLWRKLPVSLTKLIGPGLAKRLP